MTMWSRARYWGDEDSVVSSVRVSFSPRHAHVGVWNRGGFAGELTLERRDWAAFVRLLGIPLDEFDQQRVEADDAAAR